MDFNTVMNIDSKIPIYAISDLHGDIEGFIISLRDCAGVIKKKKNFNDENFAKYLSKDISNEKEIYLKTNNDKEYPFDLDYEWCGTNSHVIIVGDILDSYRSDLTITKADVKADSELESFKDCFKNPDTDRYYHCHPQGELKLLLFINIINKYAKEQNGRLIKIIGNHEMINFYYKENFKDFSFKTMATLKSYIVDPEKIYCCNTNRTNFFNFGKIGYDLFKESDGFCSLLVINNYIFVHGELTKKTLNEHKEFNNFFNKYNYNEADISNYDLIEYCKIVIITELAQDANITNLNIFNETFSTPISPDDTKTIDKFKKLVDIVIEEEKLAKAHSTSIDVSSPLQQTLLQTYDNNLLLYTKLQMMAFDHLFYKFNNHFWNRIFASPRIIALRNKSITYDKLPEKEIKDILPDSLKDTDNTYFCNTYVPDLLTKFNKDSNYTIIVGHCPQCDDIEYGDSSNPDINLKNTTYNIKYKTDKTDILMDTYKTDISNAEDGFVFGMTMECKNDNNFKIYHLDVSFSRAFEELKMFKEMVNFYSDQNDNESTEKELNNYLLKRTPQILKIVNNNISIIRSSLKNTLLHQPRPFLIGAQSSNKLKNLIKKITENDSNYRNNYTGGYNKDIKAPQDLINYTYFTQYNEDKKLEEIINKIIDFLNVFIPLENNIPYVVVNANNRDLLWKIYIIEEFIFIIYSDCKTSKTTYLNKCIDVTELYQPDYGWLKIENKVSAAVSAAATPVTPAPLEEKAPKFKENLISAFNSIKGISLENQKLFKEKLKITSTETHTKIIDDIIAKINQLTS